uniref:Uncharacterized protein n=1 Tax=Panagrellus redivivus TaxID=6233 RepID=A0A7E4VW17_PANRE
MAFPPFCTLPFAPHLQCQWQCPRCIGTLGIACPPAAMAPSTMKMHDDGFSQPFFYSSFLSVFWNRWASHPDWLHVASAGCLKAMRKALRVILGDAKGGGAMLSWEEEADSSFNARDSQGARDRYGQSLATAEKGAIGAG